MDGILLSAALRAGPMQALERREGKAAGEAGGRGSSAPGSREPDTRLPASVSLPEALGAGREVAVGAGQGMPPVFDIGEEGANLLALQTRQLLSGEAHSLATQADQEVLRHFA